MTRAGARDLSPTTIAELLGQVRGQRPRVHVLTSPVAANPSANALLALGATPSMTPAADSVAEFVASAGALVVNLGMLEPARRQASYKAVEAAVALGKPWLLDPVKVDRSEERRATAEALLKAGPSAVRCNRGEALTLAGEGEAAWRSFAEAARLTLAVTGAEDFVTDGARGVRLANGHPLMDRVTAMGCAASALAGAFLAVEADPFRALSAALAVYGVAGEVAGQAAQGPGSFEPAFLDALHNLDEATLQARLGRGGAS